jgi:hypothetical protein
LDLKDAFTSNNIEWTDVIGDSKFKSSLASSNFFRHHRELSYVTADISPICLSNKKFYTVSLCYRVLEGNVDGNVLVPYT